MHYKHFFGELACLKFDTRAIERGALVSRPVSDAGRYDRIADFDGRLYRVQVKYGAGRSTTCSGVAVVHLQKRGRPYTKDEIDAVAVYVAALDRICWFGPEIFHGKQQLQIRTAVAKNRQRVRCLMAKDYFW